MIFIFKIITSLLIISLLSAHTIAQTADASCTTARLETYFSHYADDIALQRKNIAPNINWSEPIFKDNQWEPADRHVATDTLTYPLVPDSKTRTAQNIKTIIYDSARVIVMSELGEYFRTYAFSPADCTTLVAIEDWTLQDELLLKNAKPGLNERGNRCLARGELLSALAGPEERWSLVQMFEASLQNHLCAADEGSSEEAVIAVMLSLSGQAPRLDNARIYELLVPASKSNADAAYMLSAFYCDEGVYDEPRTCKDPVRAEAALVAAAKMGEINALVALADSYERGLLVTTDKVKALGCYRLAVERNQKEVMTDVRRLESQLSAEAVDIKCF